MNKRAIACGLMLLGLTAFRGAFGAEGVPTREQLTNKLRFKIPFQFEANDVAKRGAEKVQLLESRDRGGEWTIAQTVDISAERFQYQATESGSYWFALRMADKYGRAYAESIPKPGLKVRIDADKPKVKLDLTQPSPGTVHVAWDIHDENLEMTSFRLKVRSPGSREWVEPSLQPLSKHHYDFKITQAGVVKVELSVSDAAGNEEVAEQSLQAAGPSDSAPVRRNEKVAEATRGMGGGDPLSMSTEFPDITRRQAVADRKRNQIPVKQIPGGDLAPSLRTAYPKQKQEVTDPPAHQSPRKSSVQFVNTLRFQLKYAVQDVATDELESVELYWTSDGGATWTSYGIDEDLRSPFLVDVAEPGEYGLQLVVRDRAGNGGPVPEDGTAPSMSIIVDQKAPELELISVTPESNDRRSAVEITWRAADDHPAEFPIALSFAEKLSGPWIRIATKLPNTGTYVWEPATPLPEQIFVRIEARDAAGNLRVVETPRGIRTDVPRSASQNGRID